MNPKLPLATRLSVAAWDKWRCDDSDEEEVNLWELDWTYRGKDGKMQQGMPDWVRDQLLEDQIKNSK